MDMIWVKLILFVEWNAPEGAAESELNDKAGFSTTSIGTHTAFYGNFFVENSPSHSLHLPHGRFINWKASHQAALFANNKRHSQHMEPGPHREQILRKHFNRILIQIPNKQQMNDKMINHLINDNTQDLTVCLFAFSSDKTLTMCANWFYPKCQMIAFQFHELRNVSALWN